MKRLILLTTLALLLAGCGTHRKISSLKSDSVSAELSIPDEKFIPLETEEQEKDTVETSAPESVLIMNAVKDENGEMVATDVIRAAKVTARFRNVAERHGKVDLKFQVTVPGSMQDSRWQVRLYPDMYILGDTTKLEPVIITGAQYRKRQMKGYEQYRKFLESIITDENRFLNMTQLEIFIKRNIPALYKFRNDSSYVSDEVFASVYGVTEQAAIEHYTYRHLVQRNERRKSRKDKMFRKYVKAPIVTEGIRLDTVVMTPDGDFIYDYTQTINTCPGLKKAEITMSGKILEEGQTLYNIPKSKPLTFYISSLSSFADQSEKYLKKVISRRVSANTVCYVDFNSGKSDIDMNLGHNREETSRIRKNICDLVSDREFVLDSIVVTASSSPEGQESFNRKLSEARAASIAKFFSTELGRCTDSLKRELGTELNLDSSYRTEKRDLAVKFISVSAGENWTMLDALIGADTTLTEKQKEDYRRIREEPVPDKREGLLAEMVFYKYLREHVYPRLRTVKFDFSLHRKGMVQDTIVTTVVDTAYMSGVQAITDRDYKKAISILKPYGDYNLAVAYCAMDYNASALDILEKLEKTDRVHYMLAVIYSRTGKTKLAAEHYETACSLNPSYVHRGNLDPEISALIRKYGLNNIDN